VLELRDKLSYHLNDGIRKYSVINFINIRIISALSAKVILQSLIVV